MKAAVLCPGPSLPTTWKGRADYHAVAAVNRAVLLGPADWWVFGDINIGQLVPDVPNPPAKWFTTRPTHESLTRRGLVPKGTLVCDAEDYWPRFPRIVFEDVPWTCFSMTMGIVAMYLHGATSVDVYGCDMTTAPDFDGVELPSNNRDADRWAREARYLRVVSDRLRIHGCTVQRIN